MERKKEDSNSKRSAGLFYIPVIPYLCIFLPRLIEHFENLQQFVVPVGWTVQQLNRADWMSWSVAQWMVGQDTFLPTTTSCL